MIFIDNLEFNTIHKNKVIDMNNETIIIIMMNKLLKKNLF